MLKRMLVVLASVVSLGAGATVEQDAEAKRVQEDVKAIANALYAGDVDTVLRFTLPMIIEAQGGMEKTRATLQPVLDKFKSVNMKLESLTFPKPPEFLQDGDRRFAIVPTLSVISGNGQKVESLNFQLGVLEKGSTQWHYVEGSRVNAENVQILFPGFPKDYKFPETYRKKVEP